MKQNLALPHCVTLRCSEQMEFIKHDGPHVPTMLPDCSHHCALLVGIKPPRMKFCPPLLPAQLFPESGLFCRIQKKRRKKKGTDGNQRQHWLLQEKAPIERREDCPFFHLVQIFHDRPKDGSFHLCSGWHITEQITNYIFHIGFLGFLVIKFFQILAVSTKSQ